VNRVVVDFADRRSVWAMPDWASNELAEGLPDGWNLHLIQTPSDGSTHASSQPSPDVLEAVKGARAYIGFGIPEPVLQAGARTLEWVHTGAAGVGSSLHEAMRSSQVRFTNSAGIHGPPIAETVVGMLLYFTRGLDFAVAAGQRGEWDDAPFLAADTPVRELASTTVGILGYGGIGREIGRRVAALGSPVIGLRRSSSRAAAEPSGIRIVSGATGLDLLLNESDALVIATPDTPETRGLMSAERLRQLRRGAILVNVARGQIVDEDALVGALRDQHLRGAGLDVFHTEPLPEGHPLWSLPNVLITPHTSAVTRDFWRRETDLIVDNLARLVKGEPLRNEVDRARGY